MNTASILSAIALVCYLLLIELSMRSPQQRRVNHAFAAYLGAMAFWQFAALMVSISQSDAMALFWYRLMTVGSSGNFIFLAMFVQAYLGGAKKTRLPYVGWGSLLFLLATSFTGLIVRSVTTSQSTGLHVPEFGPARDCAVAHRLPLLGLRHLQSHPGLPEDSIQHAAQPPALSAHQRRGRHGGYLQ